MSPSKHTSLHDWLCIFTIMLLVVLLLPSGSALAQDSTPSYQAKVRPSDWTAMGKEPSGEADLESAGITQVVLDGGFEAFDPDTWEDPYWTEYDSLYYTPLCFRIPGSACDAEPWAGPHTGTDWAWFGGGTPAAGIPHTASLSQTVTFPACGTGTLEFYLWIPYAEAGSGTDDVFSAKIDGTEIFSANAAQKDFYPSYTLVSIDLNTFTLGTSHTLEFSHINTDQDVWFHLDDVSVEFIDCPTISGNAGAPGVVLSYMDGTAKEAVSGNDGSYSLSVSPSWSGTVTPAHPCYTFDPPSRTYAGVVVSQAGQNFKAIFNNAPECSVTVGVFRPSNGLLYLKNSNLTGYADVAINYGIGGDYPIAGDWDGDGVDTIGIYRNGVFYLRNSNTIGYADLYFAFGSPGDQPIAGDWDGDGIDTIGVYRSSDITFYLRNSNDSGTPDASFRLGIPGDVGIAGDWDGDGKDTTGVFRPSNGIIYLKNQNTTGYADIAINYGIGGDKPVTGDWNNDGIDTIGVLRGNVFYLRNSNTVGYADVWFALGIPGDMPIAGNWDGKP